MKRKVLAMFLALIMVLSVSSAALAAPFTPSGEQKPAPEIEEAELVIGGQPVEVREEEGEWIFVFEDGLEIQLLITSIAEKENSAHYEASVATSKQVAEIKTLLAHAAGAISGTEDMTLIADNPEFAGALIEEFKTQQALLAETNPMVASLSITDLVLTDLFDVSLVGNDEHRTAEAEEYIKRIRRGEFGEVTLNLKLSTPVNEDQIFLVVHNFSDVDTVTTNRWEVLPRSEITLHDDTVSFKLSSLSCIAFFTARKDSGGDDDPGKKSPQTSESDASVLLAGTMIMAALAAGCFLLYKKQKKDDA